MKARAAPGPPSPPQPTTRPTAERQGHAEAIEAPVMNGALRPWWTAHDRLGGLLRDGLIDRPDHEAAAQLRSDIEAAGGRVSSHMPRIGVPIGGGGGDRHEHALRRARAAVRVRAAKRRLGAGRFALLRLVLDDRPWAALARRMEVTADEAKALAAAAIGGLR